MGAFLRLFAVAETLIKTTLTARPNRERSPKRIQQVLLALRAKAVGTPTTPGLAWHLVADAYRKAARKAARDAQNATGREATATLGGRHQESAQGIFAGLAARVDGAIAHVGQEANEVLKESIREKVSQGDTPEAVAEDLAERGVKGFTDRAGRKWSLTNYVGMVARTTQAQAQTEATVNTLQDNGVDLVRVSEHPHPADICSRFEGHIYSISGDSDTYPTLVQRPPFHPNCKHVLEVHKSQPTSVVTSTSEEDVVELAADRLIAQAQREEPQISEAIQSIAQSAGGQLEGFAFRLKGKDSMLRKMRKKLVEKPDLKPEEADKAIKDSVRYTMTVDPEHYRDAVLDSLDELRKQGFEISERDIKNSWPEDTLYKGINLNARRNGMNMELQFHTPESFRVKMEDSHPLYEEQRLPTTSPERKKELNDAMKEMFAAIEVPAGVGDLGTRVKH